MQLINPSLVGVTRTLISSQGGNPWMINNDGTLNPDGVLALFWNNVEIRTSVTPPIKFPIGPTGTPSSPSADLLVKSLKPTVILSGPAGQITVAPYGTVVAESWWPAIIAGGLGLALVGWLVFGQRR